MVCFPSLYVVYSCDKAENGDTHGGAVWHRGIQCEICAQDEKCVVYVFELCAGVVGTSCKRCTVCEVSMILGYTQCGVRVTCESWDVCNERST